MSEKKPRRTDPMQQAIDAKIPLVSQVISILPTILQISETLMAHGRCAESACSDAMKLVKVVFERVDAEYVNELQAMLNASILREREQFGELEFPDRPKPGTVPSPAAKKRGN